MEAITVGDGVIHALTNQLKNLENKKAIMDSRYHEWRIKQEQDLISIDDIQEYLNKYYE
ncbi:MAG: hypothetical protein K9L17_02850 [Clostridiales bacterium]|nr:hypothetical protein [Clostridiales bacterium]